VTTIYIDADACPVKDEVYRVAERYELPVVLVANARMRVPDDPRVRLEVVSEGFDAADDRIVERAEPGDIVVTADIPLAARVIEKGAAALSPVGKIFDEDNVGDVLATRDLMTEAREAGVVTGGPPPMGRKERSEFLQRLDQLVHKARRRKR
jgi:uncharacterized protein YaiI (UPF0178 family)